MTVERTYQLVRQGNLLLLRAAVSGNNKNVVVRLLLNTGASYTVLPIEILEAVGCDAYHPLRRMSIVAANGTIRASMVAIPQFHCLGQQVRDFPVVAHTLPARALVDGLIGMDFLNFCRAVISIKEAVIRCR